MARAKQLEMKLSAVLHSLQRQITRIEGRLDKIESRLEDKGASDPRGAWAAPAVGAGGFAGVSVSTSSTPASAMLERKEILLSNVDEQIVALMRARDMVCAEDVRAHFKYKGKNAASARLNRLYELGLLEKKQAGRAVYYKIR